MKTIEDIIGRTIKDVDASTDYINFIFEDGAYCRFCHYQECCETVEIEDVNGDWADLIGTPLLVAEERVTSDADGYDSETWTFYTFRTIKGSVDVRWHGSSNGYYSESVDFDFSEARQ